ncbi:MAG TPA: Crp/Fnr family transcriptional regulator [Chitinophagaceae bacterium]|nr:Crp/Fnr family transcriptional regulator [Chitinophagaceae bacterium]
MKDQEYSGCNECKARMDSIFDSLNLDEIQKLDHIKACQFYKKGEVLFNQGAYPRGLFCVQSGKIKVTQTGIDGKEQIVHLIHDGNVMGHRAILSEDKYSCSAVAMEDSHVCFIPKAPFYSMVEQNSKLALKIAHLLSDELKEAEQKITHTSQHPVKDRLAQALLYLKQNYGFESDQATLNVTIKREDLANLVGTTRETATRLLYEFQENKLIELVGKKIRFLNESKLIEMAQALN